MRGYFGVGVEGISKPYNLGAILRTSNAFGASFAFTVNAAHEVSDINKTDTSRTLKNMPYYSWDTFDDMRLPQDCPLVGIELTDDALDLPSFRHPVSCAYILGPEKGALSPEMQAACLFTIKIPTQFCLNVSLACALTLYDRTLCHGGYPKRPIMPGGPELSAVEAWTALRGRHD